MNELLKSQIVEVSDATIRNTHTGTKLSDQRVKLVSDYVITGEEANRKNLQSFGNTLCELLSNITGKNATDTKRQKETFRKSWTRSIESIGCQIDFMYHRLSKSYSVEVSTEAKAKAAKVCSECSDKEKAIEVKEGVIKTLTSEVASLTAKMEEMKVQLANFATVKEMARTAKVTLVQLKKAVNQ